MRADPKPAAKGSEGPFGAAAWPIPPLGASGRPKPPTKAAGPDAAPMARGRRGSITVECCVCFPIIILLVFTFLSFIKVSRQHSALIHIAHEAACELAAISYPLSFLNSLEDELIADGLGPAAYGEGEAAPLGVPVSGNPLSALLGAKDLGGLADLSSGVSALFDSGVGKSASNALGRFLLASLAGDYSLLKEACLRAVAEGIVRDLARGSSLDPDRIVIRQLAMPSSRSLHYLDSASGRRDALEGYGVCNGPDDVVLILEYAMGPLVFGGEVSRTAVAVTRGWVNGGGGEYSFAPEYDGDGNAVVVDPRPGGGGGSPGDWGGGDGPHDGGGGDGDEGGPGERRGEETVYITNYGEKYHHGDCEYLKKSKIPIKLSDAVSRGYTPCKICVLKTAVYVWK